MVEKEIKKLNKNIKELNIKVEKSISFKRNILLSIFKGFGTVIGGTIVVAILFTIVARILQYLGGFPYLQELLDKFRP